MCVGGIIGMMHVPLMFENLRVKHMLHVVLPGVVAGCGEVGGSSTWHTGGGG